MLTKTLDQFLMLCSQGSNISPALSYNAHAGDTELKQGVAINPAAAAQCVLDYRRTVAFIRGLHCAIKEMLSRSPKQKVRILYAGCGPYAAILLPLLSIFKAHQLDICLLDIHEESLTNVQKLVHEFNFNAFNIRYFCENACDFISSEPFDIILAETMQKALEQEPQFLVTEQLSHFLKPTGVFLPEKITIELCIKEKNASTINTRLTKLFELTAENAPLYLKRTTQTGGLQKIGLGSVIIPTHFNSVYDEFIFSTHVKIYGTNQLTDNEAEITLVTTVFDLQNAKGDEQWQASYRLGPYPVFEFIKE
jgi:SAM-dependent methyltransferase